MAWGWVVLVREKHGEWRDWFASRNQLQPRLKLDQQMAESIRQFITNHFELEARIISRENGAAAHVLQRARAKAAGAGR